PDHPITLSSMNSLAGAYQMAGQLDRAIPLFEQALEKQRIDPGPDHIDTLSMMRNLATAYREAGRFGDALRLLEEALKRSVATLGADDPLTQATRRHLALTQLLKSRTEQYEQRRAAKGDDDRDTLTLRALVGYTLRDLGSLQAAEDHLRAAYEGRRRILG